MKRIGVLSLQGDFAQHIRVLGELGIESVEVRRPNHMDSIDGLIIPGGESTAFNILLNESGLFPAIQSYLEAGKAVWGTCAGAIMLGKGEELPQPRFSVVDVEVLRNAYGRQVDSFITPLDISVLNKPFDGVFIRAPRFTKVGLNIDILAQLNGEAVMLKCDKIILTAFHPELTPDNRVHAWFVDELCG